MKNIFVYSIILVLTLKIFQYKTEKIDSYVYLSKSNHFNYNEIKNLIVFGDSHSGVLTNFKDMSYYGPKIQGNNWSLHLCDMHKMKLWSFAINASGVKKKGRNFRKQYNYFKRLMTKNKKFYNEWNSKSTIFGIWIGYVDVKNSNEIKKEEMTKSVQNEMFYIIENLYNNGAKNIILFNVLPCEKAAYNYHHNGALNRFENITNYFNDHLKEKSMSFVDKHLDINFIMFNVHDLINKVINNCEKYKFKDCKSAWIKNMNNNIEEYFWYDMTHLSCKANEIISKELNELLFSITKSS